MANNTTLNSGSGGDTITDLDIGTFTTYPTTGKVPAAILYVGPDTSAAPTPLSNANPLPVSVQGPVAVTGTFWQATQPVSGTITADQGGSWTVTANAGTGSFTVAQPTAANLNATVVQGGSWTVTVVDSVPLSVSAAQSGSWAVTANAGTNLNTSALALESGGNLATIAGAVSASKVNVNVASGTVAATPAAATSGGATPYHLISAASTNASSVKGSAGVLYSAYAFNANASVRYLKLFDKATLPTLGTDTPVATYPIPPSNGGVVIPLPVGIEFGTGIALAITGGIADSDATAIGANDVALNLAYK